MTALRIVDYGAGLAAYLPDARPNLDQPVAVALFDGCAWEVRWANQVNVFRVKVSGQDNVRAMLGDLTELRRAFRAQIQATASASKMPLSRRAGVITEGQEVPAPFAQILRQMRMSKDPRLGSALRTAYEAGWLGPALARCIEASPQTVYNLIRASGEILTEVDVPSPPTRPLREPAPEVTLSAAESRRLRNLAAAAAVRGKIPADDPRRQSADRLARSLANHVERGVTKSHLARVLGVTPTAIALRLGRYGHTALPPSQSGTENQSFRNRTS